MRNDERLQGELAVVQSEVAWQAQNGAMPSVPGGILRNDSNTASPDTNHWLSDDWESNSQQSLDDDLFRTRSRKMKPNSNGLSVKEEPSCARSVKPPLSRKPPAKKARSPQRKDSMTHPLSPSMIDFGLPEKQMAENIPLKG